MPQSAPGKFYREGISWPELFQRFPDDAAAEAWFEQQRWGAPGAPSYCPLCGSLERLRPTPNRRPLPYWCGACRSYFSVRTNTVMHRSRLGLQKWVIAIYLWATSLKGVSSMKLHRDLGITQKSAWFLAQRIRAVWQAPADAPPPPPLFAGPVEVDETYIGGKRKSMHAAQRKALTGRGAVGKTAVVGALDRAANQMLFRTLFDAESPRLFDVIAALISQIARSFPDRSVGAHGLCGRSGVAV